MPGKATSGRRSAGCRLQEPSACCRKRWLPPLPPCLDLNVLLVLPAVDDELNLDFGKKKKKKSKAKEESAAAEGGEGEGAAAAGGDAEGEDELSLDLSLGKKKKKKKAKVRRLARSLARSHSPDALACRRMLPWPTLARAC